MPSFLEVQNSMGLFWNEAWNFATPASDPRWRVFNTSEFLKTGRYCRHCVQSSLKRLGAHGFARKLSTATWALSQPRELETLTKRERSIRDALWSHGLEIPDEPSVRFVPDDKFKTILTQAGIKSGGHDLRSLLKKQALEVIPPAIFICDSVQPPQRRFYSVVRQTLKLLLEASEDRVVVEPLKLWGENKPRKNLVTLREFGYIQDVPFTGGYIVYESRSEHTPDFSEAPRKREESESDVAFFQNLQNERGLTYSKDDWKRDTRYLPDIEPYSTRSPHNTRRRRKSGR